MAARRSPVIALAMTLVILLGLGGAVAWLVDDTLGLRTEQAEVPTEQIEVAAARASVTPPAVGAITAPAGLRFETAEAELRAAIAEQPERRGTVSVTVTHGDAVDDDAYTVTRAGQRITIEAAGIDGAVLGLYDLAAAVRDDREIAAEGTTRVESRLPFRMADIGAVGVPVDTEAYADGTDYSHHSNAFAEVILPEAPFVDAAALAEAQQQFEEYARHLVAEGFTAVAFPGFLEYVTFDGLTGADGQPTSPVYADGDDHLARALAMRDAFGPMFEYAEALGLDVFLRTDMLALSTPLEAWFERELGGIDTESPAVWDVYAQGLDELYAAVPSLDGVLIRIGEAGRVYDLENWDYYSALEVRSVASVRAMLTAFSAQAEASGREVIFRTWSVGVGAVGDMHTNQDSYRAVLDGLDSPALIVSTKYTLGDFYSYLPHNDTLEIGEQRRIIEFQSRREFEVSGALPNDLGVQYRDVLERMLAANPNIEGVWVWTQDGGPWRAGPLTLELREGFWQLYELNTELAVRLARDPSLDPAEITQDWIRRWFGDEPALVAALAETMALSRQAVTEGLYLGPFAEQRVSALGLEPPPMMWIFEWDILTGDSAVLDITYTVVGDRLEEAIAQGHEAVATAERMRELVTATDAAAWRDPVLREEFLATLDYQVDLLGLLAEYRTSVLRHAEWLDTGSADARAAWSAATERFLAAAEQHEQTYGGDLDHPAFNLTAARIGIERAARDEPMAWAARGLLVLVLGWLAFGAAGRAERIRRLPGAGVARAHWVSATQPWRAAEVIEGLGLAGRILLVAIPAAALVASRGVLTWFVAPAHLLVTLGAWLLLAIVLALLLRGRALVAVAAAVGGAALLRTALLLAALAPNGPGGYWFGFWTDPVVRAGYLTVAFALLIWVLVAGAWALGRVSGRRRATGVILLAAGTPLAVLGGYVGTVGLETAMTVWNDQLSLLPWGLSRILGLTVYLEIPEESPWAVAVLGALLMVVGAVLALMRRRMRLPEAAPQGRA